MTAPVTREQIEQIVRRKLEAAIGAIGAIGNGGDGARSTATHAPDTRAAGEAVRLVNKEAVERARANGGRVAVAPGAIITPLARELAEKAGVELVEVTVSPAAGPPASTGAAEQGRARAANPRALALGSDHGGFALKTELLAHARSLGYQVTDLGTHDESSVDYPDVAHAVALAVARGEAARGIVIDGAGIGSAITANKVPGVRAAHCHNLFEVRNSREHNDANVLSLGGRVIGGELAKAMVTLWLETPFGGGRHARRVDKIRQVEEQYLRG